MPQVRRAKAYETRQDPAGSSGKCGDRCCGVPGAFSFLEPVLLEGLAPRFGQPSGFVHDTAS